MGGYLKLNQNDILFIFMIAIYMYFFLATYKLGAVFLQKYKMSSSLCVILFSVCIPPLDEI